MGFVGRFMQRLLHVLVNSEEGVAVGDDSKADMRISGGASGGGVSAVRPTSVPMGHSGSGGGGGGGSMGGGGGHAHHHLAGPHGNNGPHPHHHVHPNSHAPNNQPPPPLQQTMVVGQDIPLPPLPLDPANGYGESLDLDGFFRAMLQNGQNALADLVTTDNQFWFDPNIVLQ